MIIAYSLIVMLCCIQIDGEMAEFSRRREEVFETTGGLSDDKTQSTEDLFQDMQQALFKLVRKYEVLHSFCLSDKKFNQFMTGLVHKESIVNAGISRYCYMYV